MHYSGIVVKADPRRVDDCRCALEQLPGVEVHYIEPESGRLVVVQETASAAAQAEGLRWIQGLPLVKVAALVEHRIEPDDGGRELVQEGGAGWS